MKITASSKYHDTLSSTSFTGCEPGVNIRRLRGPRSRYCLDYSHANRHVCGCGYPVARTDWDAGDAYGVRDVSECGADGDRYGRGFIRFEVYNVAEQAAAQAAANEAEQAALVAKLNKDGTFKH